MLGAVSAPVRAASPAGKYVVQQGDTLSGIAAQLNVRGGWPALYAANRQIIGPDPDLIVAGTVLVLPGQHGPVRYTVAAGDTLSGIAAALAVRGGWPALYAANRQIIGPDPGVIRPGTVLAVPAPPAPPASEAGPARPEAAARPEAGAARLSAAPAAGAGHGTRGWHAAMAQEHAAGRWRGHRARVPGRADAGGPPPAPDPQAGLSASPRPAPARSRSTGSRPPARTASCWPTTTGWS